MPKAQWSIPMPNILGIKPNRLYITQLHDELNRYKVNFDLKSTHTQLVNLLNETLKTQTKQIVDMTSQQLNEDSRLGLSFLTNDGNTPGKSHLSAEDMMRELYMAAEMGHLTKEKISQKVDTIRG
ncbi:2380_t:CDS:2 [Funneliformis mosseae]|uniref:2380_t:CDS:1 n=1 Tax=Funneliformis mosseae TaxID=27381 RepID=A0A9N8V2P9_FUNMO|nr:2380_t:CDS:2 [Funneliformis mosseae]